VIGFNNLTLSVGGERKHTETIFIVMSNPMMNKLCTLVLVIMVLLNSINMGAQLEIDIIVEVFKKPIGPMVGFVSQFLFMPLFSFLVGWIITDDYLFRSALFPSSAVTALILLRLGLFVLGCCPGGTGSNFWTLLLKGDINLSITMTFLSTVAALGMMPLWIYLMGPLLTQGRLVIPFQQLIISLMGLILPTLLGMWVRWRWPRVARLMEKIIVPFTLLTVFFILTVGVWINLFIFLLITPLMVLAGKRRAAPVLQTPQPRFRGCLCRLCTGCAARLGIQAQAATDHSRGYRDLLPSTTNQYLRPSSLKQCCRTAASPSSCSN
jgi:sodium/bile acid cotransporter 3/5